MGHRGGASPVQRRQRRQRPPSDNGHLKDVIDAPSEQPWGIRVERAEVKDVSLPEFMNRSMSRQAEAERERRARIISADGEYQASKKLRSVRDFARTEWPLLGSFG